MLTFIAVALIFSGGAIFSLAFKAGYQKLGPILVGSALVVLGFYLLPASDNDQPDIYYRK